MQYDFTTHSLQGCLSVKHGVKYPCPDLICSISEVGFNEIVTMANMLEIIVRYFFLKQAGATVVHEAKLKPPVGG